MAVARDDLGRAARKRGIEGQVTIIRHFGIRCIPCMKQQTSKIYWNLLNVTKVFLSGFAVSLYLLPFYLSYLFFNYLKLYYLFVVVVTDPPIPPTPAPSDIGTTEVSVPFVVRPTLSNGEPVR